MHDYNAFELEADKRFSNNWSLQASYRYSRTTGNFEGFFRNDNGQSDPGITSLFDFPTNDPTYVTLGREEGFRGDIRYLGTAGIGPLRTIVATRVRSTGTTCSGSASISVSG